MLDRKIKDTDADVELLEDRKKRSKIIWWIFSMIGWTVAWISILLLPYKYDEIGIGAGIVLLIVSTWFLMDMNYYNTLIMMKKLDKRDEK